MSNPFNFGTPVSPKKFVGRWDQVEKISDDLLNVDGHSHAIIGGRRSGKSSFLEALQYVLLERLKQSKPGGWYVLPLFINLKKFTKDSLEAVFGLILNTLFDFFNLKHIKRRLGVNLNLELVGTKLDSFKSKKRRKCSLSEFSDIFDEFLERFANSCGTLRLVLLLDEIEEVIGKDWTEDLFSQLRSLAYEGWIKNYIRYVIAGSSEVIDIKETGSPLLNILKLTYLVSLTEKDTLKIIKRAGSVPTDVAEMVMRQSGGHPFITQYLMHYLWESDISKSSGETVLALSNRFSHERYIDLERWQLGIGKSGRFTYKFLAKANDWLTEAEVRELTNNPKLRVGPGLVALCYHNLAIHDGTWTRYRCNGDLFRTWFLNDFLSTMNAQEKSSTTTVKISDNTPIVDVQFRTPILPTAYCHSLTAKEYPFIICKIDNSGCNCTNSLLIIQAAIQGFSEICSDTIIVPSGQIEQTQMLPKIKRNSILELNEIRPAQCRVTVQKQVDASQILIHDKVYDLRLHATDTALLATLAEDDSVEEDLSDYLSVFVTPHTPEVEEIIAKAANRHPDLQMVGYQGATNLDKARDIVRSQAKAFFNTLKKDYELVYTNAPLNFGKLSRQVTQRVRLPKISLKEGKSQANCIDGTVLFSTLLQSIGIEPLIVIVPGHAFVGWRIWPGTEEYDFLETTMIGYRTFEDALKSGNEGYNNALGEGLDKKELFDPDGFIRIVDVAACRRKGIDPLM